VAKAGWRGNGKTILAMAWRQSCGGAQRAKRRHGGEKLIGAWRTKCNALKLMAAALSADIEEKRNVINESGENISYGGVMAKWLA
jgi:hypothetical protein